MEVNMGVVIAAHNAIESATKRIDVLNKEINDISVEMAKQDENPEFYQILEERRINLTQEKANLIKNVVKLRRYVGKTSFGNNYIYREDNTEFGEENEEEVNETIEEPQYTEQVQYSEQPIFSQTTTSQVQTEETTEDDLEYEEEIVEEVIEYVDADEYDENVEYEEEIETSLPEEEQYEYEYEYVEEIIEIVDDSELEEENIEEQANEIEEPEYSNEDENNSFDENDQTDDFYDDEEYYDVSTSEEYEEDEEEKEDENDYFQFEEEVEEVEDSKIRNLKIVYDRDKYTMNFDYVNDGKVQNLKYTWVSNDNFDKKKIARRYKLPYKLCKNMDVNVFAGLYLILDKKFGTNLAEDYVKNNLKADIVYNLRKINNSKLPLKNKIKQYIVAMSQKKFANATVYHSRPVTATAVMASFLAFSSLTANAKKGAEYLENYVETTFEANKNQATNGKKEKIYAEAPKTTEPVTETPTTQEITEVTTESKKDKKVNMYDPNKNYATISNGEITPVGSSSNSGTTQSTTEVTTESTTETKEVTTESKKTECDGLTINDRVCLVNRNQAGIVTKSYRLTGDAWGGGGFADASDFDCDYFKISCMTVLFKNEIIDIIEPGDPSTTTNELYRKYGADIDIVFNFDGYVKDSDEAVCEYVGWLNIDEFATFTDEQKRAIVNSNPETATKKKTLQK